MSARYSRMCNRWRKTKRLGKEELETRSLLTVVIGSDGFEAPLVTTTFAGDGGLEGQPALINGGVDLAPWQATIGITSTVVVQDSIVNTGSQAVRFDRAANSADRVGVIVADPVSAVGDIVTAEWRMYIPTPTPIPPAVAFGPVFGFEMVDDSSGPPRTLGFLGVDQATREVLFQAEDTGFFTPPTTGDLVSYDTWNDFKIELDFSVDEYTFYLNGVELGDTGFVDRGFGLDVFTDGSITGLPGAGDATSLGLTGTAYFDDVVVTAAPKEPFFYVSSNTNGNVDGIAFADEDILRYDSGTDTWSLFLDGSSIGLAGTDINAFHVNPDESVFLSIESARTLPGVGLVDDSDIVLYDPTSGTYSMFFDGSDFGLDAGSEDIDAISFTSSGDLVISTNGNFAVPGASGRDADLLLLDDSTGTFSIFFDGSDVSMTTNNEDVNAVSVDIFTDDFLFSTIGNLRTPDRNGDNDDVFTFDFSSAPGDPSLGTIGRLLDGDPIGFGAENIDGLTVFMAEFVPALNEAPEITTMGPVSVPENQTSAIDIDSTDDNDSEGTGFLTYSFSNTIDGEDNGEFTINSSTGVVTFISPPDFETPGDADLGNDYEIEVTVTDSGGLTDVQTFTVFVTDVLEVTPPEITVLIDGSPINDGDTYNFPTSPSGGSGATETFVVRNTGTGNLILQPLTLTGTGFLLTSPNFTANQVVSPGNEVQFTVAVDTSQPVGIYAGDIDIPSNDTDEPVFDISLTAEIVLPSADPVYYFSSNTGGNVGGVAFADEDILRYDSGTDTWSRFLDGSTIGLGGSADINAFHVNADDSVYLSIENPRTLPGVGLVDDSDIVLYDPNLGMFSMFFDGSDFGLDAGSEDVDAISFTSSGDLVISTTGNYVVPGASGSDADLILFDDVAGTFSIFFDGSDESMTTNNEDVNGLSIDILTDDFLFSTIGNLRTPDQNGDNDDVFTFDFSGSPGDPTLGTIGRLLDGDTIGFGAENIDGLTVDLTPASASFALALAVDDAFESTDDWLA